MEDYLIPLLEKLAKEKKETVLMGDFNINILNCNSDRNTSSFTDTLYSNSFYPTINIPTRITSTSKTLIDNILYNNITKCISAGNIVTSFSDHLMQYIFIPGEISEKPNNNKIFKRKYTAKNLKKSQFALDKTDWKRILDIGNKETNNSFQIFLQTIEKLHDKICPVTAISKRKQNLKLKPWITSALTTSMKIRDNIYKTFCKAKEPNLKKQLHEKYKIYRNQIVTLTRVCKENYYQSFFENNKTNSKKIWSAIRSILNMKNTKASNKCSLLVDKALTTNEKILLAISIPLYIHSTKASKENSANPQ